MNTTQLIEHFNKRKEALDNPDDWDWFMEGYFLGINEFGWHPYPDEKPDEETRVFVNICNKYFDSRLFCEDTFGLVDNAVVAWMPIPEYKEGGEE